MKGLEDSAEERVIREELEGFEDSVEEGVAEKVFSEEGGVKVQEAL